MNHFSFMSLILFYSHSTWNSSKSYLSPSFYLDYMPQTETIYCMTAFCGESSIILGLNTLFFPSIQKSALKPSLANVWEDTDKSSIEEAPWQNNIAPPLSMHGGYSPRTNTQPVTQSLFPNWKRSFLQQLVAQWRGCSAWCQEDLSSNLDPDT